MSLSIASFQPYLIDENIWEWDEDYDSHIVLGRTISTTNGFGWFDK